MAQALSPTFLVASSECMIYTMRVIRRRLLLSVGLLAALGALAQMQPGPFTAAQSTAGRGAYLTNCASCHLNDLAGLGQGPTDSSNRAKDILSAAALPGDG